MGNALEHLANLMRTGVALYVAREDSGVFRKAEQRYIKVSSLFEEAEVQKVVKARSVLILPDGGHPKNAVQMVLGKGGHCWTNGHLCRNPNMCLDGAEFLQAETLKLGKAANTSTAIERKRRCL